MDRLGTSKLLACAGLSCAAVALLFHERARRVLLCWLEDGMRELAWRRLPRKIIFIRHGEAQHNLEGAAILQEDNPNRKPDNLSELTPLGREQARAAGHRLRRLLGGDGTISAVVSPFERTQQTLYALQQNLGDVRVRCVHVDPRVREQEFGNFQVAEDMPRHKRTASEVGRFYYRRPTGESGADVYDRAASFWDSLLGGSFNMQDLFRRRRAGPDDALLVVTHGLTMRLLMMRYFSWSPQTFDAVYNPGNCDFWVLVKDEARRAYRLEPADCSPPCMPWATRQVQVMRKAGGASGGGAAAGLVAQDYTLVDYLALPQPRTSHLEAALQSLVPGHGHHLNPSRLASPEEREAFIKEQLAKVEPIEPSTVHSIDWWCGKISEEGVGLRMDKSLPMRRTVSACRERGRSRRAGG